MLGFIKKDILMIKSNFKFLIILFMIYVFMAFQGQIDLAFFLSFMSVMIMMSTFSYDEFNKWDAYACSLPNGRKNSVRAKYLATLLVIIVITIIVTIISLITTSIHSNRINYEDILSSMLGTLFAVSFLQSLMYPVIYKFGVEKARIGIFIAVFGITIISGIIIKLFDFEVLLQKLEYLNNYLFILLPIGMLIMLYLSYKISARIYQKKEY